MLRAAHQNRSILCLIERRDTIHQWIKSTELSENKISAHLLELLLTHQKRDDTGMIWITTEGTIKSVNAFWLDVTSEETPKAILEKALYYSSYTDLIFFNIFPYKEGIICSFVIEGVAFHEISISNLAMRIKREIGTNTILPASTKENIHANIQSQNKN